MKFFKSKNKIIQEKIDEIDDITEDYKISDSLDANIVAIKKLFEEDDTFIIRSFVNNNNSSLQYCIIYLDGMVDPILINENIIKPLMLSKVKISKKNLLDSLINHVILINDTTKTSSMKEVIENVTHGNTILFIDGIDRVVILNTKGYKIREIKEPDSEKVLSGPREGFTESLITNISLIRRKIGSNKLKIRYVKFGETTNTTVCICYIDGIVNKNILEELYQRLNKIKIDAVLDVNYITELIKDSPFSLFRTTGYTERPDTTVGKMLEGRIALLVDGSPVALTIPYLFIENFQSSEDYYLNFYYASFSRLLRILGFMITILLPGFFIATAAYHPEMLPTPLLINIALERQNVPLPAALEAIVLLILFDILKETSIRMPANIGQALSIVGALVIGQAAVDAELVAAPMMIIVASTGITSLLVPKINAPIIYIRLIYVLLASLLGFYGLVLGFSYLIIHLINLRSFGVPHLMLSRNLNPPKPNDEFIRAPWWKMTLRPKRIASDRKRLELGEKKQNG